MFKDSQEPNEAYLQLLHRLAKQRMKVCWRNQVGSLSIDNCDKQVLLSQVEALIDEGQLVQDPLDMVPDIVVLDILLGNHYCMNPMGNHSHETNIQCHKRKSSFGYDDDNRKENRKCDSPMSADSKYIR